MTWREVIAVVLLLTAIAAIGIGGKWYTASVQTEVYRRQGVEMTTWEVFMGAKPVERYVKP
jgi:hypothetical protein